ncbi:MAG TPA: hypothetical protein VGG99_29080 [Acetobacteraceae bacterium]|jgi:hypothetical protein
MESNFVRRYQEYRRISGDIQSAALESVPGVTMIEFGRRLGAVWHGKVALDEPNDLKLLYDIAIHTAKSGRTRAIDRYARQARFPDGSDNARILHSLRNAYCTMFEFRSRHNVAGVIAWDLLRKQEFHMMDVSLGLSAKTGDCYVGRLMDIDGFSMSCLMVLPIDMDLLEWALPLMPQVRAGSEFAAFQDMRCAVGFYRAAIASGHTARCVNLEVEKELPTEEMVEAIRQANDRRSADWPERLASR